MLLQRQNEPVEEARYDTETLKKVTVLAERLRSRQQETLTAREMEAIGAEVGLEPSFIRTALAQLTWKKHTPDPQMAQGVAKAWWAAGWAIPFTGAILGEWIRLEAPRWLHPQQELVGMLFLLGWAAYLGGGVLLSHRAKPDEEERGKGGGPAQLSRTQLIEAMFALERELERQKQRRAFLSIDVVGSTEMKHEADELAVEHSFTQFRLWVEEIARKHGGQVQSAAGDGMMCMFPTGACAVRAAREIQEGLPSFNAERSRLSAPFRVRCGINAGEIAVEDGVSLGHLHSAVIDRAALLQKHAAPGDIVVSGAVAQEALTELGVLAALPEPVQGEPAFSWRAGNAGGVPSR